MVQERYGPYVVEGTLGSGGMGEVYRARDTRSGALVALKIPHAHYARAAEYRARFQREASVAATLASANIVRVLDHGEADGLPYLAMEYVDGPTLAEVLAERAPLPVVEAVALAIQIAEGLAVAHAAGVVHRDLKPSNVLLGTDNVAGLTDFGIAQVADGTQLTATGLFVGSAEYAAPERARGQASEASDLYSLGILLFHMLSGRPPFRGETPYATIRMHEEQAPPDLSALREEIPDSLAGLVIDLLEKDARRRPPSAEEVGARLGEALRGLAARGVIGGTSIGSTTARDHEVMELPEPDEQSPSRSAPAGAPLPELARADPDARGNRVEIEASRGTSGSTTAALTWLWLAAFFLGIVLVGVGAVLAMTGT